MKNSIQFGSKLFLLFSLFAPSVGLSENHPDKLLNEAVKENPLYFVINEEPEIKELEVTKDDLALSLAIDSLNTLVETPSTILSDTPKKKTPYSPNCVKPPKDVLDEWRSEKKTNDEYYNPIGYLTQQITSAIANPELTIILNIAKFAWDIVKEGKPTVEVKTMNGHALPKGVSCWVDLHGWKLPVSKKYQIKYRNKFRKVIANFVYQIIYTYGGSTDGRGQYLTGIRVIPHHIKVLWGFKLRARSRMPNVINVGTRKNPIAGAEVLVSWEVSSPLAMIKQSGSYFVQGDGQFNVIEH